MNRVVYILFVLFHSAALADPVNIYGSKLEILQSCQLQVNHRDGSQTVHKLNLPHSETCTFIKHAETNIVHIERVYNIYALLVESTSDEADTCVSTYTAAFIKPNGTVEISDFNKKSGSCYIDRERKVFEYFAHSMVGLK
ncbi:hypothetical protein [Photobacterium kasasachensis]|uniref:hypothetical protein n=1 Tax=Photobacterium kasasachensis TaxID=2910240 RepID=UPI003D0ECF04